MENKLYVSLDIGSSTTIALIAFENKDKQIEIIGSGIASTPSGAVIKGFVKNPLEASKSVKQAIEAAQQEAQGKLRNQEIIIREVTVGLGGDCVRNIEVSDYITRENPEKIIDAFDVEKLKERVRTTTTLNSNEDILSIIPKKFKVDDMSLNSSPIGMVGTRMEGLFIVKIVENKAKSIIEKTLDQLQPKIKVRSFVPTAVAGALAVLTKEEKEAGVAVIDIGGDVCNVLIYSNKVVQHIEHHLYAGNIITKDIKESTGVLIDDAERLKVGHGIAYPQIVEDDEQLSSQFIEVPGIKGTNHRDIAMMTLSEIIAYRCEEIIDDFYTPIEAFNSHRKFSPIQSVVITGGGSNLVGLKELIEARTGLSVRIGYPEFLSPTNKEQNKPQYAVAIGLITKAIEQEELYVSLGRESGSDFVEQKSTVVIQEQPKEPVSSQRKEPSENKQKSEESNRDKDGFFGKMKRRFSDFLESLEKNID